jgi:hypothetical protein
LEPQISSYPAIVTDMRGLQGMSPRPEDLRFSADSVTVLGTLLVIVGFEFMHR